MSARRTTSVIVFLFVALCAGLAGAQTTTTAKAPDKVYVPYENLKPIFESQKQGVFIPYSEFQRLWRIAEGSPAGAGAAPVPYLISSARFSGKVGTELASLDLRLTVDILADGWVQVPIGLGEVAVDGVAFVGEDGKPAASQPAGEGPLLRVQDGQYFLLAKGKGRHILKVDFVRQLVTKPGLNVLSFKIPASAISTLELLIPEENMKVDVKPMLAATTSQVTSDGKPATKLQAFLGSAEAVELSWQPRTQAAAELEPVVIEEQLQIISVSEALVSYDITFNYEIRRRGIDTFDIQLPPDFRVTAVDGANISKWDIPAGPDKAAPQQLSVKLFSPAKDKYTLTVRMERFLQEAKLQLPLTPILTRQAVRRTGLIAISHTARRSVEVSDPKNLARVDTGKLPEAMRNLPGVTAHRFISSDYSATLLIDTVLPRISLNQLASLAVENDRLNLQMKLRYNIERAGVFQLTVGLPEPWEVLSVGPKDVVDDHQFSGQGAKRTLTILLKKEVVGAVELDVTARMARPAPDAEVNFALPMADQTNLHLYSGQVVVYLAEQFRADVTAAEQLQPLALDKAGCWANFGQSIAAAMAYEFRQIDPAKPAGLKLRIAVKPAQISAVVHRLVNIQPGAIEQEALVRYRVLYAPVDTFYVKLPAALADANVQITGAGIKEKPRVAQAPGDGPEATSQAANAPSSSSPAGEWAYYKIVLQSPVMGDYDLRIKARQAFQAGEVGKAATVVVEPILAAGKLTDQSGTIAIAKGETLAIGEPTKMDNLIPADPGSAADLPYEPFRQQAALAFKYSSPPFALALPVVTQKEAAVFTTIASAAIIEQVLGRDGTLNGRVVYLLATSKGDRLPINLPPKAKLYAVMLNGAEAPVEAGATADQRIIRLPLSAGAVSKIVLDISYGLDKAAPGSLTAPELPPDIPVQQTLWRLWVPQDSNLLAHDKDYATLTSWQADSLLSTLNAGQPTPVAFRLSPQGQAWQFSRQGAPGKLWTWQLDRQWFSIAVWVVIILIGVALLPFRGLTRLLIVLGLLLVGGVINLAAPLLAGQFVRTGLLALTIVAGLWLAQWAFVRLPKWIRANMPGKPAPVAATPGTQTPPASDQQPPQAKE